MSWRVLVQTILLSYGMSRLDRNWPHLMICRIYVRILYGITRGIIMPQLVRIRLSDLWMHVHPGLRERLMGHMMV